MINRKRIIIIEGPDASGKSTLCKHIQGLTNGKCHTIHSNFCKELPKENHRRQHKLIAKFVSKQFDNKHYTNNHTVILDRCYVSDMTYGKIGYGSKGTIEQKFRYLDKLFKILTKDKSIDIYFIYCKPKHIVFDKDAKEELLTYEENDTMQHIYDSVIFSSDMFSLFNKYNILCYTFDFTNDSDFTMLDNLLERRK